MAGGLPSRDARISEALEGLTARLKAETDPHRRAALARQVDHALDSKNICKADAEWLRFTAHH